MPAIIDQYNGSLRQLLCRLFQRVPETLNQKISSRVAQPKQEHADAFAITSRNDFAEIEIECQYDPAFPDRLPEDFAVRQLLQTFVAEMGCVMTG